MFAIETCPDTIWLPVAGIAEGVLVVTNQRTDLFIERRIEPTYVKWVGLNRNVEPEWVRLTIRTDRALRPRVLSPLPVGFPPAGIAVGCNPVYLCQFTSRMLAGNLRIDDTPVFKSL